MSEDTKEAKFAPLYLKLKNKLFFHKHENPKLQILAFSFKQETIFLLIRQLKHMQETTL